jgi:hypothetical protein
MSFFPIRVSSLDTFINKQIMIYRFIVAVDSDFYSQQVIDVPEVVRYVKQISGVFTHGDSINRKLNSCVLVMTDVEQRARTEELHII